MAAAVAVAVAPGSHSVIAVTTAATARVAADGAVAAVTGLTQPAGAGGRCRPGVGGSAVAAAGTIPLRMRAHGCTSVPPRPQLAVAPINVDEKRN